MSAEPQKQSDPPASGSGGATASIDRGHEGRAWFEQIITQNYRLLFATAYRQLGNAQDAEDAVQTSVLKAFGQLETLKNPATVVGWLVMITRRTGLDMRKRGGATKIATFATVRWPCTTARFFVMRSRDCPRTSPWS
jgi:DNA-directed RNA polymerase specialized sigma24 family protein